MAEPREAIFKRAAQAIRAGVIVTWGDWVKMTNEERLAWTFAREVSLRPVAPAEPVSLDDEARRIADGA